MGLERCVVFPISERLGSSTSSSYPFLVALPQSQNAIQERAIRTLKQKKMYEAQISQLTQQTFNMESAAIATDNLRNTMATLEAMKVANKEIKKQYGKIDIDKIENMHYDMEELLEQANEIQETLGRSYAVPDELDEADLEAGAYSLSSGAWSCSDTGNLEP